ncbi:MAG: SMI1/KNR4 family protein [Burkholderiales bacterium]|nr:SMI1/KNR4 family protein [Anaerolineae bacterium]
MDYKQWVRENLLEVAYSYHMNESAFVGCTPEEVHSVMKAQGVEYLPQIYDELLLLSGKTLAGVIPMCSLCSFDDLSDLKLDAVRVFSEEGLELPSNAFVFYNHLDHHIFYFLTEANEDNPVVFEYFEGKGIMKAYDHFSEFIIANHRDNLTYS